MLWQFWLFLKLCKCVYHEPFWKYIVTCRSPSKKGDRWIVMKKLWNAFTKFGKCTSSLDRRLRNWKPLADFSDEQPQFYQMAATELSSKLEYTPSLLRNERDTCNLLRNRPIIWLENIWPCFWTKSFPLQVSFFMLGGRLQLYWISVYLCEITYKAKTFNTTSIPVFCEF